jgi:hypothetical protein
MSINHVGSIWFRSCKVSFTKLQSTSLCILVVVPLNFEIQNYAIGKTEAFTLRGTTSPSSLDPSPHLVQRHRRKPRLAIRSLVHMFLLQVCRLWEEVSLPGCLASEEGTYITCLPCSMFLFSISILLNIHINSRHRNSLTTHHDWR